MSRIRRLGLVAVMAVTLLVGGAPAFATEPLTTNGHVTDPDSFLSDEQRATIESPAQSFYSTYNTIIDVVVVPNFSGQKPSDWCKATLKQSRTGEKGILYVVSYEDGTDAFCTDAKMAREMSDYSTRMMMDSALSAAHRKYKTTPLPPEEAAAGAEAFIRDLRSSYDISADLAASHRKRQEQEKKAREEREKEEKKRKRGANILISAVVVIAIVSNVWVWVRKLNGDDEPATETTYRTPETEEYTPIVDTVRRDALRAATEARRRLSEAEEQVRAAEEDWNYARAQFGSAATEQFGHRLEAAKDAIARGFDTYEQIERTPDAHAKRRLASTITADLDKNLPPLQDARQEFAAQSEKRLSLPAQVADARERLVEELADEHRGSLSRFHARFPPGQSGARRCVARVRSCSVGDGQGASRHRSHPHCLGAGYRSARAVHGKRADGCHLLRQDRPRYIPRETRRFHRIRVSVPLGCEAPRFRRRFLRPPSGRGGGRHRLRPASARLKASAMWNSGWKRCSPL